MTDQFKLYRNLLDRSLMEMRPVLPGETRAALVSAKVNDTLLDDGQDVVEGDMVARDRFHHTITYIVPKAVFKEGYDPTPVKVVKASNVRQGS